VVDGSNLATEGRTLPSLAQLDEAVRVLAEEHPDATITVVVDATFEHRIDKSERETVRLAMLNGEVVSPPAGAIGRGDAFVLRIAERTGAIVVSNDSFQEFHGEHPWLFDKGRLVGGKPVLGVGWIFTPRLPIRGPKSRAATAKKRSSGDPESAPAKAAELAKAAQKAAKKTTRAAKKSGAGAVAGTWPLTPATPPPSRKAKAELSRAIGDAVAEALDPTTPAKAAAKKTAKKAATATTAPATKNAATKAPGAKKVAKSASKKEAGPKKAASSKASEQKKSTPKTSSAPAHKARTAKRQSPPPAVNEPLTFINFVAAFPVGSTVQGEVVSFTSHGAMVDVAVPRSDALHCYIPLSAMGNPPPVKARQVLKKGEVRSFVLAGLDPPRRVAELALPTPSSAKRAAAKSTAAAKTAAKKTPAKKSLAKKSPAKKSGRASA
jgi:hypothetical protein